MRCCTGNYQCTHLTYENHIINGLAKAGFLKKIILTMDGIPGTTLPG